VEGVWFPFVVNQKLSHDISRSLFSAHTNRKRVMLFCVLRKKSFPKRTIYHLAVMQMKNMKNLMKGKEEDVSVEVLNLRNYCHF
jgi:tRNA pseudouridine-54 N-methylase